MILNIVSNLIKFNVKKNYFFFGAQVDLIRGYSDSQDVDAYGSTVVAADTLDRLHVHRKRVYDKSHHLDLLADAKKVNRAAAVGPERVETAQKADERRIKKVETFCCPAAILKTMCDTKCCLKLCVQVLLHVLGLLFVELLFVHSMFVKILNIVTTLLLVRFFFCVLALTSRKWTINALFFGGRIAVSVLD